MCSTSNERAVSNIVRVLLGDKIAQRMRVFAGGVGGFCGGCALTPVCGKMPATLLSVLVRCCQSTSGLPC